MSTLHGTPDAVDVSVNGHWYVLHAVSDQGHTILILLCACLGGVQGFF